MNTKNNYNKILLCLSSTIFIYLVCEAGETIFLPLQIKLLFSGISPLGFSLIPLFWLIFVLHYVNNNKFLKNKSIIILLSIIPIITLIGGLTNSWHHLLWTMTPVSSYYGSILLYNPGILIILYYIYCITIILISLCLTLNYMKKVPKSFKKPSEILIIATIIPLSAAILKAINFKTTVNPIPLSYLISLILFTILIFYYKGLDYIPLVQETFIENVPIGMLFFDKTGALINLNPASKLLNIAPHDLNKNIKDIFKNNPKLLDFYHNKKETIILNYKENKWFEINKKELFKDDENKIGTVFTIFDVSDIKLGEIKAKKQKDELDITVNALNESIYALNKSYKELNDINNELNKSNKEKAVLIKEVHHRVKNNLQIILSLLSLDERFNKNTPTQTIESTRNRIKTMALIHEKTYQSEDLANINAKEFIITNLKNLMQLYNLNNEIQLKMDLEDIYLPLGIITPLGLIINELFTNSIKYAFDKNYENKTISVSIKEINDYCSLIISDNGKGLPKDLDILQSPSLGLTIVNSLTQQLEGEFKTVKSKGAGFEIKFPITKNFWIE